ncbi:unnamed protein product [Brugia timori]|uniref:Uncharacterized protein n=1 Tax=Brugia timori TaxID=42155 RepID=A0A0R3QI66_9BILA|nr:unnamed protein product [Brugia timori]
MVRQVSNLFTVNFDNVKLCFIYLPCYRIQLVTLNNYNVNDILEMILLLSFFRLLLFFLYKLFIKIFK